MFLLNLRQKKYKLFDYKKLNFPVHPANVELKQNNLYIFFTPYPPTLINLI